MFDQVQTFSSNILRYKQMFHRLITLSQKACESGKKSNQSQTVFSARYVIISAGHILWAPFIRCFIKHLFARLATQRFS